MSDNRFFQYLAGDRKGEIVIFDKIEEDEGIMYVCFKDKARCNEEFILPLNQKDATGKIMAEIESPNNCWHFKDEWVGRQEEIWELNAEQERVCVQPFIQGRKVIRLIPPRSSIAKFGFVSNLPPKEEFVPLPLPPITSTYNEPGQIRKLNISDPVFITLDKAKKVDTDIDMVVTISLPPKNLYKVMKESFEEGDKKVIEYIIDNMDVKYLKEKIGDAVLNMYESDVENITA